MGVVSKMGGVGFQFSLKFGENWAKIELKIDKGKVLSIFKLNFHQIWVKIENR